MASLTVTMLGSMHVEIDGEALPAGLSKKELWLLALLTLRQGKPISRDYLAGTLWPDCSEEQALYNLRRALNRMRDALGAQADRIEAVKPRSLSISLTDVVVDVTEFDRLAAADDLTLLRQAIDLYRAPLLQGCFEEWALAERTPREFAYQRALDTLCSRALEREDWNEAERCSRLRIAADPLQEQAHRALMTALAQTGNYAAATGAYRDLRLRLHAEVNADPAPETQALYESIRSAARQNATVSVESPVVIPAAASAVPSTAEPKSADPWRPARVPVALNRLIGRSEELQAVTAQLGGSRLVTLVGAGGVGKTRLSQEIARIRGSAYSDGAVFVSLTPVANEGLVADALAQALDITETSGKSLTTTICERLQHSNVLLVIDNCEHLVDAVAAVCRAVLSACPTVSVLATSRQPLGLIGEAVWPVAPLALPPSILRRPQWRFKSDSSAVLEYPSVQMFVERACQARPELRLGPSDLDTIGRICAHVDGIPLAIELAASRVRSLSLVQIEARIEDRFRLLRGGIRTENPHHKALDALLDWSYQLLDEPERRLFARLSVFAGGWSLSSAEAICSEEAISAPSAFNLQPSTFDFDILDLLTSLVDKSLVVMEEREGEVRYRMLETIRQYAGVRLASFDAERVAVTRRMRDHFALFGRDLAEQQARSDGARWIDRAEVEWGNLRAVLGFCAEDPPSLQKGLGLASHLSHFYQLRGFISEGKGWLEALLAADHEQAATLQRFAALSATGVLSRDQGDYSLSRTYFERAMEVAETLDDQKLLSAAFNQLGTLLYFVGEHDRARDYLHRSLAISESLGRWQDVASGLNNLAMIVAEQSKFVEARTYLERALALNRQSGNRNWELYNLLTLGSVGIQAEDYVQARSFLQQALALSEELGNRYCAAKAIHSLGIIAFTAGDVAGAKAHYLRCLPVFLQFEDRAGLGSLFLLITEAAVQLAKWEEGVCALTAAEAVYEEMGGVHHHGRAGFADRLRDTLREQMGADVFAREQARARILKQEERIARLMGYE